MLIVEDVEVSWSGSNRKHFESLGYEYTKRGDTFIVANTELSKGSHVKVKVLCDYCNETMMTRSFKTHVMQKEKDIIDKDCCVECRPLKMSESNLMIHGTEWITQTENFKEKSKETHMKNHGVEYYSQSEEHKEKVIATSLDRYGVENPFQSSEIRQKVFTTMTERYGVTNPMHVEEYKEKQRLSLESNYGVSSPLQSPEILEKTKQTNLMRYGSTSPAGSQKVQEKMKETSLERYGVPHPMQNPEVRKKVVNTLYKNGSMSSSSQQNYIHSLIGGELNYPVSYSSLDIAFPDEMIYVEYDGGGHNLNVKLGRATQEEFDQRDKRRTFFLFDAGWKEIRFVSDIDKLPQDSEILKTIEKAKYMLKNERVKTIIVNWDDRTVLFGFKREFMLDDFLSDNFTFPQKEVA